MSSDERMATATSQTAAPRRAPAVERELKFAGAELGNLRELLIHLEAECRGSAALEDNWIFDRDGELDGSGRVLRLRVDRRGARLTLKEPASFEGHVKIRGEHETTVGDVEVIRTILESLGYSIACRYQKRREEWQLGSIVVALDHTPIGDFVELEGEGCERLARRLGLDPTKAERRSYLRLYADHRETNPEAPAEMVFP